MDRSWSEKHLGEQEKKIFDERFQEIKSWRWAKVNRVRLHLDAAWNHTSILQLINNLTVMKSICLPKFVLQSLIRKFIISNISKNKKKHLIKNYTKSKQMMNNPNNMNIKIDPLS